MRIAESREGLSYEEYYETDRWKWGMVARIITSQLTHHEGEEMSVKVTMNPDMNSFHCRIDSPKGYSSYYWSKSKTCARWSAGTRSYGIQRGNPKPGTKHLIHLTEPAKLWEKV